jgi:superfamily II DNA/RNA helicase
MSDLSFADLGLAQDLLRAVADTGYTVPTPIQAQAIPQVLKGAICWPPRRPVPARPPALPCRCCNC